METQILDYFISKSIDLKYILASILTLILYSNCCGQYAITGSIVSAAGNIPVIQANVQITNTTLGAASDRNGKYHIPNIAPGEYTISVSYIGMETRELQVSVLDQDITVDFILEEDAEYLNEIVVRGAYQATGLQRLRAVEDNAIYSSKKNELIQLEKLTINQASNLSRQIYAKIVGLNIWESDGAGVSTGDRRSWSES